MARPAPALPEERFPHVARPLAAVDACLTARAVSHPEPALLPLLRAAFRGAGDAADELLSQLQADKQPKAQRVRHSARLLSPSEADQLDSEDRTRCVAVVGMKEVAITVDDPGKVVEVRLSNKQTTLWLTLEADSTRLRVSRDGAVAKGARGHLSVPVPAPILAKLFDPNVAPPETAWDPGLRAAKPSSRGDCYLPARLLEAFASVLQDHLRLQALLHVGLPVGVSRVLALESCKMFTSHSTADVRKRRTFLTANVNPSCLPDCNCMCSVFNPQRSARAGGYGVQISFTFCGAALTDGVCPIHHLAETCTDGLFGEHCMLNPRLSLRCGHPGHLSESSSFALAIPDSALPALLAIAGAACRLVNSRDAALDIVDVHERVDEIVQEAERARLEKRPVGTPVSDRDATEAMRAGERPAAPCRALFRQPKLG